MQRELWREVFEHRIPPDRKTALLADIGKMLDTSNIPGQVHVFGLSYVALAFYSLFMDLSAHTDLCIYTLNPCMEYWEDVPRGWPVSQRKKFIKRTQEQSRLMFGTDADSGSKILRHSERGVAPVEITSISSTC